MERVLRDTRINRIVEGTTDVMHLFIAREALDGHLRNAGGLFKKGATLWDKVKTIGKCALIYPKWYIGNLLGSVFEKFGGFDKQIAGHLSWAEKNTRRLALTLFHQMLLRGPKLEMRQLILARLVDIGAELAVMALVAARLQSEKNSNNPRYAVNLIIMEHFFKSRKAYVSRLFDEVWNNADLEASAAAIVVMSAANNLPASDSSNSPAMERKFCSDYTLEKS
jgi:hypothetical protein